MNWLYELWGGLKMDYYSFQGWLHGHWFEVCLIASILMTGLWIVKALDQIFLILRDRLPPR